MFTEQFKNCKRLDGMKGLEIAFCAYTFWNVIWNVITIKIKGSQTQTTILSRTKVVLKNTVVPKICKSVLNFDKKTDFDV